VIDGLQGDDTIFGDQCNNARAIRALDDGNDVLNGSEGIDSLFGSGGDDTLNGDEGDDSLSGDDGDDTLNGDEGNDALTGGTGDDKLNGDTGKNSYVGGDGDDKINAANTVKGERINCGGGKKDKATVDKKDKPKKNCEKVKVKK
jgi:Ca2+-binding RTX toxin-like protein